MDGFPIPKVGSSVIGLSYCSKYDRCNTCNISHCSLRSYRSFIDWNGVLRMRISCASTLFASLRGREQKSIEAEVSIEEKGCSLQWRTYGDSDNRSRLTKTQYCVSYSKISQNSTRGNNDLFYAGRFVTAANIMLPRLCRIQSWTSAIYVQPQYWFQTRTLRNFRHLTNWRSVIARHDGTSD